MATPKPEPSDYDEEFTKAVAAWRDSGAGEPPDPPPPRAARASPKPITATITTAATARACVRMGGD